MSSDALPLYLCDLGGNIPTMAASNWHQSLLIGMNKADPESFHEHTDNYAVSRYALIDPVAEFGPRVKRIGGCDF